MRKLIGLMAAVCMSNVAHAQLVNFPCMNVSAEFQHDSDLQSGYPAATYPCYTSSTIDSGPLYSNGTAWVKMASYATTAVGSPTSRSLSLATAYQATSTTKAALVTVNLTSTASISLSGGTTNTAQVVIGSTNAVASGTGTVICQYSNSNTGTLTVGLNLSTISAVPCSFTLPVGWFMAIRQTAGTVTITSAFDQSLG